MGVEVRAKRLRNNSMRPPRGAAPDGRLRTAAVAVFIAIVASLVIFGGESTAAARPISDCPDLHVVVVPGTVDSSVGRNPHDGRGVMAPMNDIGRGLSPGTTQTTYVPYPADFGYTSGGTPYTESVAAGVASTNDQVRQVYNRCGDQTDIAIVGYSQGADVAHRVAVDIGHGDGPVPAARVRGVYLISDPNREQGSGLIPGAPGLSVPLNGARTGMAGSSPALGGGIHTGVNSDFGALTGRVASLCITGDFACAIPKDAQLVRIVANVAEQIHIDTTAPEQIASDLSVVAVRSALRTLAYVVDTPHWMLRSESFGAVIQKATDPYYSGPEIADVSTLHVAAFLAEFPGAVGPKIQHDANAAVRENLGLLTMASHPEYWYPGPSHGSYFGRPADSSGRTGSQYVNRWLRESATTDVPSRSVPVVQADPVTEAPGPLPLPAVDRVETAIAVADTTFGVTMQAPEVVDALTDEANNLARGSSTQTQVQDVTAAIDNGAEQVDRVFDQVERIVEPVRQIVTSPAPFSGVLGAIGSGIG